MARISTHVLDTAHGRPAAMLHVELYSLRDERRSIHTAITDSRGRTGEPLLEAERIEPGEYEIAFHVADYFRGIGVTLASPPFLDEVIVRFGISDPQGDYHVPLLGFTLRIFDVSGVLMMRSTAEEVIARCLSLSRLSEEAGRTTRTFLSAPMHAVHELVGGWMREAGLEVSVDAMGNIRGSRGGSLGARRLLIGSHLDTVPNAGAYDGILGVVAGIALARLTQNTPLTVVGFSEEEGVKFGVPFLGSRAMIGTAQPLLDADPRITESIRAFGLDPAQIGDARTDASAYFEIHIEQGPCLEHLNIPLGVVDSIAGQSRWNVVFTGAANHAGTTPMHLRRDALACAGQWIHAVREFGLAREGLLATVGRCDVEPGAVNVVPGRVTASLDVRHKKDGVRHAAVDRIFESARDIGVRHMVTAEPVKLLDIPATPMDPHLIATLSNALSTEGFSPHHITSGAGHDAMVMAPAMPASMLFVRSPGGISHHPDESVLVDDVEAALRCGKRFVESF